VRGGSSFVHQPLTTTPDFPHRLAFLHPPRNTRMGDSELTLEETNKLRVSIGLAPLGEAAPLAEGEEPVLDADQVAEANYAKRREEDEKDAETK
jgi:hypothetical protein